MDPDSCPACLLPVLAAVHASAWGAPVHSDLPVLFSYAFVLQQPAANGAMQDSEYKVLLNSDTTCEVYFEPKGLYPNWKVDYVKARK